MLTLMMLIIVVAAMMADVTSRYHGGDDDDDGRYPDGRPSRIASQCEAAATKKGRGKNANVKLEKAFKKNGNRPLPVFYNLEGDTYKIVGVNSSMFTQKLSSEVAARADFHYSGWAKVPASVKNAIYSTLQHYFDLQSMQGSTDWPAIKSRIDFECARAYRDRKHDMKMWFNKQGGINNLEVSRQTPYEEMDLGKWQTITDNLWADPKKIRQAEANSQNRAKHRYTSSHGSSSYAQQLYELRHDDTVQRENAGPIQVWYNNHYLSNPNDAGLIEGWRRIEEMRDIMRADGAREDGSIDEVECLRRVLGTRRGFQPGIGTMVRYTPPDMGSSSSLSAQRTQPYEDVEARVDARVSQLVSQQMSQFLDQMRAMNPSFNFPTMPHSHDNEDEDEDGDE